MSKMKDSDPECLDIAMDDLADYIHAEASRLVPVDTGHLKANINVKRQELKKTIGTNVPYARWIEYGKPVGGKTTMKWKKGQGLVPRDTVPLGPRPFLRPAWTKGIAGNNQKLQEYFIQCLGERT